MCKAWKPNTLPYAIWPMWDRFEMEHTSHSFGSLLTEQSFTDYPDITSSYDGVDTAPTAGQITSASGWQPCMHYTSTLADALMPAILASLKTHGSIQVSVCDAGGYCKCDECRADIVAAGGDPDGYWTETIPGYSAQYHALLVEILARVRKVRPAARVVGLAYAQVAGLPSSPLPDGIDLLNTVERPAAPVSNDADYSDRVVSWSDLSGWSVYDRLHGSESVHPCLIADHYSDCLKMNTPRQLVIEGSPSWGLQLAMPYMLARLSWDVDASVPGMWRQWADDLFGNASGHVLDYVAALEKLTLAAVTYPPAQHSDMRGQLAPGPGQLDAVEDATAALEAARATDGLTDDQAARLSIIATAWDVPKTLMTWSNSEKAPTAADEAGFWKRFAGVEADNRTLWRFSLDGLRTWIRRAVDYSARRLSGYNFPVVYEAAKPHTGRFVDLPSLGANWRIDWTTTRGRTSGQARINLHGADGVYFVVGRWRAETWQWLAYVGSLVDPHYQEANVNDATVECALVVADGWWRVFVDGRQLMGAQEEVVLPTRYFIQLTGDEAITDLVVRTQP
jgi:hypothetical protein